MPDGVKKRAAKSLLASGADQVVTLAIQLIQVPLFLHFWSKEMFGEWLVLTAIPALLTMADFSFAHTAGVSLIGLVANKKIEEAIRVHRCTVAIVGSTVVVLGVGFALAVAFLPWDNGFRFAEISRPEAVAILLLFMVQVGCNQLAGVYNGVLRSVGFHHYTVGFNSAARLISLMLTVVALLLEASPTIIAGVGTFALAAYLVVTIYIAFQKAPYSRPIRPELDKKLAIELAKPALVYSLIPLAYAINIQGVITVLGLVGTATMVVVFSTARTLSRFAITISEAFASSIMFELGAIIARGELEKARRILRKGQAIAVWTTLFSILALALFGPWAYSVWTRKEVNLDYTLFLVLLGIGVVRALTSTPVSVTRATNLHQSYAYWYLGASVIGVGISYWTIPAFGLISLAWILVAIEVVILIFVVPQSLRIVKETPLGLYSGVLRPDFRDLLRRRRPAPAASRPEDTTQEQAP